MFTLTMMVRPMLKVRVMPLKVTRALYLKIHLSGTEVG
jgi:hypothetical protein